MGTIPSSGGGNPRKHRRLEDLVVRLPLDDRYTYVYLGNSQVLDHILVSSVLAGGAEVDIVHLNAEFPAANRASDHDPIVVRLSF